MTKSFRHWLLPSSVFLTGACVLVVEIAAVRILSPYFGNTVFTFSSVISVILAALSGGYYLGGWVADKHPSLRLYFLITALSGLCLAILYGLAKIVLPELGSELSVATGPLVATSLFFMLPALLIGLLSPFAVRLQKDMLPKKGVGSISGSISFFSTSGSIVGSLLTGFVFIPSFGVNAIMISASIVLFALGAVPLVVLGAHSLRTHVLLGIGLLAIIFQIAAERPLSANVLYQSDGVYEQLTVYDAKYDGRPARYFRQDRSFSSAMFLDTDDPTDLAFEYTKYYLLGDALDISVDKALVLGGAVQSIPKALLAHYPNASVESVEIEPELEQIATQYFNLPDDSRLTLHTEDGRRFLEQTEHSYDVIYNDVYGSLYSLPTHFASAEFFELAKSRLSQDGIFISNIIGDLSRSEQSLVLALNSTFSSVFDNHYLFATKSPASYDGQNFVMVGINGDQRFDFTDSQIVDHPNSVIRQLSEHMVDLDRFDLASYPVMTDDYAPVDTMSAALIRRDFDDVERDSGSLAYYTIGQQLNYGPRYIGSLGHQATQDFVAAELGAIADKVLIQEWQHQEEAFDRPIGLKNIIGRINPDAKQRILLGTHYDTKIVADNDRSHPELPVPGANDGASGVAVLLELARRLGVSDDLQVGVDFVFFDGEEGSHGVGSDYSKWSPLGSTHFADNIQVIYPDHLPRQAVVVDLVCAPNSVFKRELSSDQAITDDIWNFARSRSNKQFSNQTISTIGDDHTALNALGIPSTLIIDLEYEFFHTTEDTLDKCSRDTMLTLIETLDAYIVSLDA